MGTGFDKPFGTYGIQGQDVACDSGRRNSVTSKMNERSGNVCENKGLMLEKGKRRGNLVDNKCT
jgi:hypothetical protein